MTNNCEQYLYDFKAENTLNIFVLIALIHTIGIHIYVCIYIYKV
jgi:hypothetical protein